MTAGWFWVPLPSVHHVLKKWSLTGTVEVKTSFRNLQKNTSTSQVSIKPNGFEEQVLWPYEGKIELFGCNNQRIGWRISLKMPVFRVALQPMARGTFHRNQEESTHEIPTSSKPSAWLLQMDTDAHLKIHNRLPKEVPVEGLPVTLTVSRCDTGQGGGLKCCTPLYQPRVTNLPVKQC